MTTPGPDQPAFGQGDPGSMPPPPPYGADPTQGGPEPGWSGSGGAMAPPRNGFGVTALVLGILAVLTCWSAIGGIVLGVLAIIFAVLGIRRANQGIASSKGMPIAGLVTGIVGLVVGVLFVIALGSLFSFFGSQQFKDFTTCVQQANNDQAKIQQCQTEFQQQYNQQHGG
jgi:O-antigen ligase